MNNTDVAHEVVGLPLAGGRHARSPSGDSGAGHGRRADNDHLALLYDDRDEQLAAVAPFIERGLERGEQCLYVVDRTAEDGADGDPEDAVVGALRDRGVDVDAARESGALTFRGAEETYLGTGEFDPDATVAFWRDALAEARDGESSYSGIRAAAEMTWALDGGAARQRLAAYEAALNSVYAGDDYAVMCQYDCNRFPADVLSDVVRTHPLVVVGDAVRPNVHYVPPGEEGGRPPLDVDRALQRLGGRTAVTPGTRFSDREVGPDSQRLALVVADDANRRVLADWLDGRYGEVVVVDSPDDLAADAVDMVLVDAPAFDRHRETLVERKRAAAPRILPYLLVATADPVPRDDAMREHVDELVAMPTDPETLAWRIDTLLRMRTLSTRLARKREQVEHLARAAAHDLRNPLTVAQGWLPEVGDGKAVDMIARAHDRMEALVENVLTVAKTGDAFAEADVEPVEFAAFVDDCWSVVPTDRATLHVEEHPCGTVQAEPVLARQLFENLFRNAVEHGGTDVRVRVGVIDGGVGFYVADDGSGISPGERTRVFEEDHSLASGSGLGLAIVSRVADAHGWDGHLTESESGGARVEMVGVESP